MQTGTTEPIGGVMLPVLARCIALVVMTLGAAVLLGWTLDIAVLKNIHPQWISMKANTALCFLLLGFALQRLASRPADAAGWTPRLAASMAGLIGLLTLGEYISGLDLGIDELLFGDPNNTYSLQHPGRMAPVTAISFVAAGLALLALDHPVRTSIHPAELLTLFCALVGFLSLAGYVYEVRHLYGAALYTQLAIHTAIGFVLLAAGILCARPLRGLMTVVTSPSISGRTVRRLLPAAILLPFLLGWLRLLGQKAGLYDTEFGITLSVTMTIILLAGLIIVVAFELLRLDTERARAEEDVKSSRDQIRSVIETASDAFIAIDTDSRILDWNRQAEITFGWQRDEALGRSLTDLIIPPQHRDAHRRGLKHYLATGEGPVLNKRIEITALERGGHELPVELTIWPLQVGGTLRFNAFMHDISERKHASELLQIAVKKLERSNRALEEFARVASHDLQEPLRTIRAFGGLLKKDSEGVLSQDSRDFLDYMVGGAERMSTLVTALLDYARVSSKAQPFEAVDLAALAQDVLLGLQERVRETGAQIDIGQLPRIEADPTHMRQLLQNLIGNALKFHRVDVAPIVQIQSRKLPADTDVGLIKNLEYHEITVKDNGIGIDEKLTGRLFAPFQRLVSRDEFEGSGIGLAICKSIVERHGGRISIESKLGEGTTFSLVLPETQPESTQPA